MQLQAIPPPQLKYKGVSLPLNNLLGAGATSFVYKSSLNGEDVAIKVLQPNFTGDQELSALRDLAKAGCTCVPTVIGCLDSPAAGYLLQPVGATLGTHGDLMQQPLLFTALKPLVETLCKAGGLGWVHRDVRPSNLLSVGGGSQSASPVRVLLLDWYVP